MGILIITVFSDGRTVECPHCKEVHEITTEFFGATVECACSREFKIKQKTTIPVKTPIYPRPPRPNSVRR